MKNKALYSIKNQEEGNQFQPLQTAAMSSEFSGALPAAATLQIFTGTHIFSGAALQAPIFGGAATL